MLRMIFVPQYYSKSFLRYPQWWFTEIPKQFRKFGFEVLVLGEGYDFSAEYRNTEMFSPINEAIEFEAEQIKEYIELELYNDDILFIADLSFPGLFSNILYHKKPKKCFAFCHATSINRLDYFEKVQDSKYQVEKANALMFNKIFVGSQYHKDKLKWPNIEVTYLPYPPLKFFNKKKIYNIVSASRPTKQKVDSELEKEVEKKFGKIVRKETKTWEEYYEFLSQSKVLLLSSFEDTFGYQIIDAVLNGCIPIARNSLAYPEILPRNYLYSNEKELFDILEKALWGLMDVPKILCRKEMNNFFGNIITEMKG